MHIHPLHSTRPLAVILLGLCLLGFGSQSSTTLAAQTLCVGGGIPTCFKLIQDAINHAQSGDTITIADGIYPEQLVIPADMNLTIQGAQQTFTLIQGTNKGRVLLIPAGASLALSHVSLMTGNSGDQDGAGLLNYGTVDLKYVIVRDNKTNAGNGAGIANFGTLTAYRLIVRRGHTESGKGAGVYNAGTMICVVCSIKEQTTTMGLGGGVYNLGALTLQSSQSKHNSSGAEGAGIYNTGQLTAEVTTVRDDTTTGAIGGAGVYNTGQASFTNSAIYRDIVIGLGNGAGFYNTGDLTVDNSTLTLNALHGGQGGGIYNLGSVNLNNDTIAFNRASDGGGVKNLGALNASNTLIARNYGSTGADCSGTLASLGYNLIYKTSNCDIQGDPTGNVYKDPRLGTFIQTWSRAIVPYLTLLRGSPAINTANPALPGSGPAACMPTDQRLTIRPQGPRCDIGTYEWTPAAPAKPMGPDPSDIADDAED